MNTITNEYGNEIPTEIAYMHMDENVCEQVNFEHPYVTDDNEYFNLYCKMHKFVFGSEFFLNEPNPQY